MEVQSLIDKVEAGFPAWIAIRIVEATRTIEYQDGLYAQGRTKPGPIVTNAPGGFSYHNYGLAVDFALLVDKDHNGTYETLSWDTEGDLDQDRQKDWMEVVAIFKAAGYEWGGDWIHSKDKPHLQKTFKFTERQLLAKYKANYFIPGTKFVKLT